MIAAKLSIVDISSLLGYIETKSKLIKWKIKKKKYSKFFCKNVGQHFTFTTLNIPMYMQWTIPR